MKNILLIFLMTLSFAFFSSCGDKKANENTSKDTTKTAKKDTIKVEEKKDTTKKVVVENKDTTSTVRQTEKTQVEEP